MSASASGRTMSRTLGLLENSRLNLGPRRASGGIPAVGIESAIELRFLSLSQLQGLRKVRNAFPDRFHELETLVDWQGQDLGKADGRHGANLPPPRAVSKSLTRVPSNVRVERAAVQPNQAPQAHTLHRRLRRPLPNLSRTAPTHC